MTIMYSEKVLDHFTNPRNVGEIEDADGVGGLASPVCGDIIKLYIKVEGDRIVDLRFKTFGCAASVASGSMLTEMAKGKTIEEAQNITDLDVAQELGGLPEQKMHCSNLAASALQAAIEDHLSRKRSKAVITSE